MRTPPCPTCAELTREVATERYERRERIWRRALAFAHRYDGIDDWRRNRAAFMAQLSGASLLDMEDV